MRFLLIYLFAVVGFIGNGYAESVNFHSGTLYELGEGVKSVKYSTENPLMVQKQIKFLKTGRFKTDGLMYDAEGYPVAGGYRFDNDYSRTFLSLDKNKRPAEITIESQSGESQPIVTTIFTYAYDKEGKLASLKCDIDSEKGADPMVEPKHKSLIFEYSNPTVDDKGNWISRNVKQSYVDSDGKSEITEYVEIRKIEYYK